MWDKCSDCGLFFDTNAKLVNHIKNDHNKNEPEIPLPPSYKCIICPKVYCILEELLHHINLEHQGISAEQLEESTKARETKKQLGDYIGESAEYKEPTLTMECPECFELFSDSEKLNEHRKSIHHMQYTEDSKKRIREIKASCDKGNFPQCGKCMIFFYVLVLCKMDGVSQSVCLNCYEDHYGINALRQLTIGTPDDILDTMRKQIINKKK